jgi:RNA polymerase sigma-B factor
VSSPGFRQVDHDLDQAVARLHGASSPSERDAALDALAAAALPLARALARRFRQRGETEEDLVQVACLGLLKAAERFEPEQGTPFGAYATSLMVGEIRHHLRDRVGVLRLPRRLQEAGATVAAAVTDLTHELGRSPTVPEIATRTGLEPDVVLESLDAADQVRVASLDAPVGADADGPRLDVGVPEQSYEHIEVRETLRPLLEALPERERRIVHLRFVAGLSQSQIAEQVGVSQMQISRLLSRTLTELRSGLGEVVS